MPSVLPAGECIRRKSGCSLRTCRRRTVPWSLPLGKGRYPRCPAVGERSLSPMPCRWGKLPPIPAIPPRSERSQKIAVASRCLPPPKVRLLLKACRCGKLPPMPAIPPKWERLYQSPLENRLSFRKHPRRNLCPSPPAARRYSCAEDSLRQPYFPSGSALYCTRPASAALKTMCRPA